MAFRYKDERFQSRMRDGAVDPDIFIERLKKIRAVDPGLLQYDRDGRKVRSMLGDSITFFVKTK